MAARTWTGMALGMLFVLACDETDQRDGTSPLDAGHMLEDARATPLDAEQTSEDASRQQPTMGYRFIIENQSAETAYIQTVGGAGAPASVGLPRRRRRASPVAGHVRAMQLRSMRELRGLRQELGGRRTDRSRSKLHAELGRQHLGTGFLFVRRAPVM